MRSEFQVAVAQLIAEKGLPRETVMETVANSLLAAYRKGIGGGENLRIEVDKDGDVEVWASKKVVVQVVDGETEISLGEAQQLYPHAALGQSVDIDSSFIFTKIPAQTAKQIILQRIHEAERDHLYDQLKDWIGEIRYGTLTRYDSSRGWYIEFDRAEGLMPLEEGIPNERYTMNQKIRAYVYDIRRMQGNEVQIIVSRAHKDFVRRLFESEVPEIFEGTVEIKSIAREPGHRTKVAVVAREANIDPIGACIGVRGSRISKVVQELHNEKVDIIQWDADPQTFIANALSPVQPVLVTLNQEEHVALVTVQDKDLSLAIGKEGQNARLAARLTGWKVDILKPSASEKQDEESHTKPKSAPSPHNHQVISEEGTGSSDA